MGLANGGIAIETTIVAPEDQPRFVFSRYFQEGQNSKNGLAFEAMKAFEITFPVACSEDIYARFCKEAEARAKMLDFPSPVSSDV